MKTKQSERKKVIKEAILKRQKKHENRREKFNELNKISFSDRNLYKPSHSKSDSENQFANLIKST